MTHSVTSLSNKHHINRKTVTKYLRLNNIKYNNSKELINLPNRDVLGRFINAGSLNPKGVSGGVTPAQRKRAKAQVAVRRLKDINASEAGAPSPHLSKGFKMDHAATVAWLNNEMAQS